MSTAADLTTTFSGNVSGADTGTFNVQGHEIGNTVNATGTYAGQPKTFLLVIDSQVIVGPAKGLLVNENDSTFFFDGILH